MNSSIKAVLKYISLIALLLVGASSLAATCKSPYDSLDLVSSSNYSLERNKRLAFTAIEELDGHLYVAFRSANVDAFQALQQPIKEPLVDFHSDWIVNDAKLGNGLTPVRADSSYLVNIGNETVILALFQ